MDNSKNIFYRYRSIKDEKLFFNELEKKEIYFATDSELNDPMEGLKDVYWEGDSIIWENLIKNFILTFLCVMPSFILQNSKTELNKQNIYTKLMPNKLPENLYHDLCDKIFQKKNMQELPKLLQNLGKIKKYELINHFTKMYYEMILGESINFLKSKNLMPYGINKDEISIDEQLEINKIIKLITNVKQEYSREAATLEDVFYSIQQRQEEILLLKACNDNNKKNHEFILLFPKLYVEKLVEDLFPVCYKACFSSSNNNCAMWSHYANAHKGVCLQFTFDSGEKGRPLLLPSKPKGKTHELHRITYGKNILSMNFFENIGRIPMNKLHTYWLENNGMHSALKEKYENEEAWRAEYWSNFEKYNTFKFDDWRYENEWKIIFNIALDDILPTEQRVLNYNSKHLTGIIFGMDTSLEHKKKIIKIIDNTLKGLEKENFKFYQADFCGHMTSMEIRELKLLKLKSK